MSRDSLHALVDALPEAELTAARRYLEFLSRPEAPLPAPVVEAPITAGSYDRPYSREHRAAVQKALERVLAGRAMGDR